MIYYNTLTLDESGFDIIDTLMESPIFDEYVEFSNMLENSILVTESDQIKLDVLAENAFETILTAIKKALSAIATFFREIADKIVRFFKKISNKKIGDAVKKSIHKEETSSKETKERLLKKYGEKLEAMQKDEANNYALINVSGVIKETVDVKRFKQLEKILNSTSLELRQQKKESKESADKKIAEFKKSLGDIEDITPEKYSSIISFKNGKGLGIKEVIEKYNNSKDRFSKYSSPSKLVDALMDSSNMALIESDNMSKYLKTTSKKLDTYQASIKVKFENNSEGNRVLKAVAQYTKKCINVLNIDKAGFTQLSNFTMKAYKDALQKIIAVAPDNKSTEVNLAKNELRNVGESANPWDL